MLAKPTISAGDFACLVAEECAFDDVLDGGLFVGVQLVEGFEVEAQAAGCRAALGVGEDELVGGDVEGEGEVS